MLLAEDEQVGAVLRGGSEAQEGTKAAEPPAYPDSPWGTVLVADDDHALRESLVEILGMSGYHVLQAADGEEALIVLGQEDVDVVLLDLQMPGMDGVAVLEALTPPFPKVILLSAFARYSPEDIDRMGLGGKVTRSLRKPVPPIQLLAAISDAIGQADR